MTPPPYYYYEHPNHTFEVLFNGSSLHNCSLDAQCPGFAVCFRNQSWSLYEAQCACPLQPPRRGGECELLTSEGLSYLAVALVTIALAVLVAIFSGSSWLTINYLRRSRFIKRKDRGYLRVSTALTTLASVCVATTLLAQPVIPSLAPVVYYDPHNGKKLLSGSGTQAVAGIALGFAFYFTSGAELSVSLVWLDFALSSRPGLKGRVRVYLYALILYFTVFLLALLVLLYETNYAPIALFLLPPIIFISVSYVAGGFYMSRLIERLNLQAGNVRVKWKLNAQLRRIRTTAFGISFLALTTFVTLVLATFVIPPTAATPRSSTFGLITSVAWLQIAIALAFVAEYLTQLVAEVANPEAEEVEMLGQTYISGSVIGGQPGEEPPHQGGGGGAGARGTPTNVSSKHSSSGGGATVSQQQIQQQKDLVANKDAALYETGGKFLSVLLPIKFRVRQSRISSALRFRIYYLVRLALAVTATLELHGTISPYLALANVAVYLAAEWPIALNVPRLVAREVMRFLVKSNYFILRLIVSLVASISLAVVMGDVRAVLGLPLALSSMTSFILYDGTLLRFNELNRAFLHIHPFLSAIEVACFLMLTVVGALGSPSSYSSVTTVTAAASTTTTTTTTTSSSSTPLLYSPAAFLLRDSLVVLLVLLLAESLNVFIRNTSTYFTSRRKRFLHLGTYVKRYVVAANASTAQIDTDLSRMLLKTRRATKPAGERPPAPTPHPTATPGEREPFPGEESRDRNLHPQLQNVMNTGDRSSTRHTGTLRDITSRFSSRRPLLAAPESSSTTNSSGIAKAAGGQQQQQQQPQQPQQQGTDESSGRPAQDPNDRAGPLHQRSRRRHRRRPRRYRRLERLFVDVVVSTTSDALLPAFSPAQLVRYSKVSFLHHGLNFVLAVLLLALLTVRTLDSDAYSPYVACALAISSGAVSLWDVVLVKSRYIAVVLLRTTEFNTQLLLLAWFAVVLGIHLAPVEGYALGIFIVSEGLNHLLRDAHLIQEETLSANSFIFLSLLAGFLLALVALIGVDAFKSVPDSLASTTGSSADALLPLNARQVCIEIAASLFAQMCVMLARYPHSDEFVFLHGPVVPIYPNPPPASSVVAAGLLGWKTWPLLFTRNANGNPTDATGRVEPIGRAGGEDGEDEGGQENDGEEEENDDDEDDDDDEANSPHAVQDAPLESDTGRTMPLMVPAASVVKQNDNRAVAQVVIGQPVARFQSDSRGTVSGGGIESGSDRPNGLLAFQPSVYSSGSHEVRTHETEVHTLTEGEEQNGSSSMASPVEVHISNHSGGA